MKKVLVAISAVISVLLFTAAPAFAYGGSELSPKNCKPGRLVTDVVFKLVNDYDSGVKGNAWANDTIHRELKIWNTGSNTYCATVRDDGSFVTFDGYSPNGSGHVSAGIKGDISGGYTTGNFTASFLEHPDYRTFGNAGTFDLQCTDAYNCPGAHPTISSYVSGSYDLTWWGWKYTTARHGHWINSIDADTGDIIG